MESGEWRIGVEKLRFFSMIIWCLPFAGFQHGDIHNLTSVLAAGDYASVVCVPLALRCDVASDFQASQQSCFREENASQARIFSTYHGESANIELRTLQKA